MLGESPLLGESTRESPSLSASPLVGWPAVAGSFDECRGGFGLRPHWRTLSGQLADLGAAGLEERRQAADALLRENGVTFQVHAEGSTSVGERPWQPDPLPVVIASDEWRRIEAGLLQRQRLAEALLADAYGPQRLIAEGVLPPAAYLAHPGFLRPLHGVEPPGGRRLVIAASDLVRGPDGQWTVVADRAQSPSGAGYALETRIATNRALPEAFRACRVQRLAPFFVALRRALAMPATSGLIGPASRDHPRIALLTPGTASPTYFEHAWLARYLGFTLVEGADLTVRDETVYLKTLGGLHRIDVILRRLDDDWCDPLELRDDSLLGVPGLVAAVRAGNLAVANALGTGLAENGAWLAHADLLCRTVLGEAPLLPVAPTWWGGDDLRPLLDRLDTLLIRPSFHWRSEPIAGWLLSAAERSALAARIAERPWAWIGQEVPPASYTPAWIAGRTTGRHLGIRVFACAGAGTGEEPAVMPGGLVCLGEDPRLIAGFLPGSGSKDCWVLADGPVAEISLLRPVGAPLVLKRGSADLPSRVADNLFWFGRYAERCEGLCRLFRPCLARLNDEAGSAVGRELAALVRVLGRQGLFSGTREALEPRLAALVTNPTTSGGVGEVIGRVRRCAVALRDRLSNDTWRAVHSLAEHIPNDGAGTAPAALTAALDRLVIAISALAGMAAEGTTRGPGWRFLDLGRRLERGIFTTELLRGGIADGDGDQAMEAVLEVADSAITYRSRYLSSLQAPAVVDLLLTDPTNPRALAFLLDRVVEHVQRLPQDGDRALPGEPERLALGAATWVKLLDPHELCRRDEDGARPQLEHVLDHLGSDLERLSASITTHYLTHAGTGRPLTPGWAQGM